MLVCGTVALDLVARVPRLPTENAAVRADAMDERPGGCGGNAARALARLGHEPVLLSAVGADFEGTGYEAELHAEDVDLSHLVRSTERPTARAFLASDPDGGQVIVYHDGATREMTELSPVGAELAHFTPGELTAYPKLMDACELVTFDPGQETFYRDIQVVLDCLPPTDILLCNHHELDRITEHTDGLDGLLGLVEAVVVTDPRGQDVHTTEGSARLDGVDVEAVDPTGAGDAHAAGVLHGLSEGWDLPRACRFGSAVAACVVEHPGAQQGLPTLEQAMARYRDAYGPDG